MVKMSRLLKKKTAYIIIGISIACLILGPVLGLLLDKITIYDKKTEHIYEDSSSGLTKAFAQPVTLSKDQKLIVEISEFYPNTSITVKIIAKSIYDQAYSLNSTPGGISGLWFVYSEFGWGTTPAGSTDDATALSLPGSGIYFYIEFMGDRVGDSLISWPGDYFVIVYGTNSGPASVRDVYFDISIKVDGPGETLNNLLLVVGALILVAYAMLALVSILKANYLRG
ncbi:MAG: hypothetical protein KGD72_12625 [Candidatus Lokiarchaeota archaeon]|nr:hypothetical protein [Candidatus Lokiarchaeota archaeon]